MEHSHAELTQDQLIHACVANFLSYDEGFAIIPRNTFHKDDTFTWIIAHGAPGNAVLSTQITDADPLPQLDTMLAFMCNNTRYGWWMVTPTCQPANLGEYLLSKGLSSTTNRPVMTLKIANVHAPIHPATDLHIERVSTLAQHEDWFTASIGGFESTAEDGKNYGDVYAAHGFAADALFQHYVGYLNSQPVTSSTLLLSQDIAGIYDVSSIPEARGQGFGEAITRVALEDAQQRGYKYAVLQASDEGFPLYIKMGFTTLYIEENYEWRS